jgi:hypothetical protein
MVIATASVFAQAKPSFAGKWVLVPPADAPAGGGRGGGGRGGFGQEMTIEQTDKTLTITRTMRGESVPTVYNIGGDTKVMMGGRGGEGTEVVVKTAWVGSDLVMTSTMANGERKQVLSLKDGNLVVTTTQPGREGGPQTTTATYKKG